MSDQPGVSVALLPALVHSFLVWKEPFLTPGGRELVSEESEKPCVTFQPRVLGWMCGRVGPGVGQHILQLSGNLRALNTDSRAALAVVIWGVAAEMASSMAQLGRRAGYSVTCEGLTPRRGSLYSGPPFLLSAPIGGSFVLN